jgi:hypothetical protein
MSEASNKALVRRWFNEVWNKGQKVTFDKLFAENGVAYGLGDTDLYKPSTTASGARAVT